MKKTIAFFIAFLGAYSVATAKQGQKDIFDTAGHPAEVTIQVEEYLNLYSGLTPDVCSYTNMLIDSANSKIELQALPAASCGIEVTQAIDSYKVYYQDSYNDGVGGVVFRTFAWDQTTNKVVRIHDYRQSMSTALTKVALEVEIYSGEKRVSSLYSLVGNPSPYQPSGCAAQAEAAVKAIEQINGTSQPQVQSYLAAQQGDLFFYNVQVVGTTEVRQVITDTVNYCAVISLNPVIEKFPQPGILGQ